MPSFLFVSALGSGGLQRHTVEPGTTVFDFLRARNLEPRSLCIRIRNGKKYIPIVVDRPIPDDAEIISVTSRHLI